MATVVRKKPGDTDDKLISQFRKRVQADKVLLELKKRERFVSKAEERHEKKKALKHLRKRKPKR